jgi:drug/metabolite transporter (DMT)-like permease
VLIVGSAFCYAVYQVFTRKVAGIDRPETSVMYSALVGTVVMSCVVPFVWTTPLNLVDVALFLSLGLLGAGGHWCVAKAMTYGQASVISPFQYWQMIGSVAVGYVVSGMFPDGFTWLGASIIVACGIALAVAESRRR